MCTWEQGRRPAQGGSSVPMAAARRPSRAPACACSMMCNGEASPLAHGQHHNHGITSAGSVGRNHDSLRTRTTRQGASPAAARAARMPRREASPLPHGPQLARQAPSPMGNHTCASNRARGAGATLGRQAPSPMGQHWRGRNGGTPPGHAPPAMGCAQRDEAPGEPALSPLGRVQCLPAPTPSRPRRGAAWGPRRRPRLPGLSHAQREPRVALDWQHRTKCASAVKGCAERGHRGREFR